MAETLPVRETEWRAVSCAITDESHQRPGQASYPAGKTVSRSQPAVTGEVSLTLSLKNLPDNDDGAVRIPQNDRELDRTVRSEVLILGVGNVLCGDDGAGIRLAELLIERPLPKGVHVEQAGLPGLGLPSWLDGHPTVILLDAVEMGCFPGEWRRFEWGQVNFASQEQALSLHQPDLSSGLALAEALELIPERLVIYAIQPETTKPGASMSAEVGAALPGLADIIVDELSKLGSL